MRIEIGLRFAILLDAKRQLWRMTENRNNPAGAASAHSQVARVSLALSTGCNRRELAYASTAGDSPRDRTNPQIIPQRTDYTRFV